MVQEALLWKRKLIWPLQVRTPRSICWSFTKQLIETIDGLINNLADKKSVRAIRFADLWNIEYFGRPAL